MPTQVPEVEFQSQNEIAPLTPTAAIQSVKSINIYIALKPTLRTGLCNKN
jgi:hypothetical protein